MPHTSTTYADCSALRDLLRDEAPSAPAEFFTLFDALPLVQQRGNTGSLLLWTAARRDRLEILEGLLARGAPPQSPEGLSLPLYDALHHWSSRLGHNDAAHRACRRLLLRRFPPAQIIQEWQRVMAVRATEGFNDLNELQGEFLGFCAKLFPAHFASVLAATPAGIADTDERLAVFWAEVVGQGGRRLRPAQLDLMLPRFPLAARLDAEYCFWRVACTGASVLPQSPARWFLAYLDRHLAQRSPAQQVHSAQRLFKMCSTPDRARELYAFASLHPSVVAASQCPRVSQVYPHLSAEHEAAWTAAFGPPPPFAPAPADLLELMKESGSLHVLQKVLDAGVHPDYRLEDGAAISTWAVRATSADEADQVVDLLLARGSQLKDALPLLARWNAKDTYARAKSFLEQATLQEKVHPASVLTRGRM